MSGKNSNRLIVVGVLKGAHGVRGEVRVKSYTEDPDALFTYGPLLDETGKTVLTPKAARPGKDHFIVRPAEQKQKEDWDALRGTLLHVPRASLPDADEDEFYIEDLVGLDVYPGGSERAGRIRQPRGTKLRLWSGPSRLPTLRPLRTLLPRQATHLCGGPAVF